jgi:hypothetical protein
MLQATTTAHPRIPFGAVLSGTRKAGGDTRASLARRTEGEPPAGRHERDPGTAPHPRERDGSPYRKQRAFLLVGVG